MCKVYVNGNHSVEALQLLDSTVCSVYLCPLTHILIQGVTPETAWYEKLSKDLLLENNLQPVLKQTNQSFGGIVYEKKSNENPNIFWKQLGMDTLHNT